MALFRIKTFTQCLIFDSTKKASILVLVIFLIYYIAELRVPMYTTINMRSKN